MQFRNPRDHAARLVTITLGPPLLLATLVSPQESLRRKTPQCSLSHGRRSTPRTRMLRLNRPHAESGRSRQTRGSVQSRVLPAVAVQSLAFLDVNRTPPRYSASLEQQHSLSRTNTCHRDATPALQIQRVCHPQRGKDLSQLAHQSTRRRPISWSAPEFLHYANHGEDVPQVDGERPKIFSTAPNCARCDVRDEAYYDGRVADEAVRVMGEIKDQPFFLAVGFWKPHVPFNAPLRYWEKVDQKTLPKLDPRRPTNAPEIAFHDSRELAGRTLPNRSTSPPNKRPKCVTATSPTRTIWTPNSARCSPRSISTDSPLPR